MYARFCILETSKWRMYQFVYEYLKPKWDDKVEICQTDTDGLLLCLKTDDFYEDIKPDIEKCFDTSNLPENNKFGIEQKKLYEIRAKMYAYSIELNNYTELKKGGKGTPSRILKSKFLRDYKHVLFNEIQTFVEFNRISSKKLDVYTINQKKVALSNFDDKRFILNDGITTLAHGHYKIKEIENCKKLPMISLLTYLLPQKV